MDGRVQARVAPCSRVRRKKERNRVFFFPCPCTQIKSVMMTTVLNTRDFYRGSVSCLICNILRAMEAGRVDVNAMIIMTHDHGTYHLIACCPDHILNQYYSRKNFVQRVFARKPNLHVVWESCLRRWGQCPKGRVALYALLRHPYFWTDLPTVQQVMADAIAAGIVAPWVRMHIMKKMNKQIWMAGCRRAWLLAVL